MIQAGRKVVMYQVNRLECGDERSCGGVERLEWNRGVLEHVQEEASICNGRRLLSHVKRPVLALGEVREDEGLIGVWLETLVFRSKGWSGDVHLHVLQ